MFAVGDLITSAGLAASVAAIGLAAWRWSRQRYRFAIGGLTTFAGFAAWNCVISVTNSDASLNVDWPVFPLSWADVGSGVVAFAATALALGLLTDRREVAWRVVGVAAIAGILAALVDPFVL